jgi:hypothetical protein
MFRCADDTRYANAVAECKNLFNSMDIGIRSSVRLTAVGSWAMCGIGANCAKPDKAIHYDHLDNLPRADVLICLSLTERHETHGTSAAYGRQGLGVQVQICHGAPTQA